MHECLAIINTKTNLHARSQGFRWWNYASVNSCNPCHFGNGFDRCRWKFPLKLSKQCKNIQQKYSSNYHRNWFVLHLISRSGFSFLANLISHKPLERGLVALANGCPIIFRTSPTSANSDSVAITTYIFSKLLSIGGKKRISFRQLK